ncbi:ABC transporter transmembrane domain-containing protein [Cyanobium sp. ATX 6F1]|uniref:ABC transporter transmembrane domain-containing protein n=2 Tax=unclassified Cyanobium TaxID=2627006 RepID=UPI0020CF483D|nr:ABC transporter transmembrane domain-containing protein [Cyanobium sp. ATX 6F1]
MRSIGAGIKDFIDRQLDLIEELRNHQFFQSLKDTDWSQYQVGPIVVSSILINLLELSSPIYINLVYTTVLPTKAFASLTLLTIGVVVLLSVSGWLRTVRTGLTGFDGARVEHQRRMEALAHFTQMRLGDYLKEPPSTHAERLNSINLLRDESAIQAFTTAIDLCFSLFFVLVLFLIGGSVGLIAVLAIVIYLLRSLQFARDFEAVSRQKDELELERVNYQSQLMSSIDLIKSNGLGRFFLIGNEERQERLAWQRMQNSNATGQYQAFSSLMNQVTMAALVTWGAFMVISGHLLVGALAACLLLGGKILQPWQQALGLWSSYRRLIHARDELDTLMALPVEPAGGSADLALEQSLQFSINGQALPPIGAGEAVIVRDASSGADARHLFLSLLQIETDLDLQVNGLSIADYNRERLRREVIYVDPAQAYFDGTLLQNITSFQPNRYSRKALFWSVLVGTDDKVRSLSDGYSTPLGGSVPTGLSRDTLQQFQLIRGVTMEPRLLLVDLSECSYGKEFIDGFAKLLKRTHGRTTVLICGAGNALKALTDQSIDLPALNLEVAR